MRVGVFLSAGITVGTLAVILGFVFFNGIPHVNLDFLLGDAASGKLGIYPAIITTVYIVGLALLIAAPIGICTAIYLNEYAKRGSKFVKVVRLAAESLSGIPSIVFGLFGMIFFVTRLGWRWSILAGVMTVSIMILPTMIRSTEESLKSVPDAYREGSFGLGAGKLRTFFVVVLPSALPGIIGAIILSMGRIVGETAALMLTAGTMLKIPKDLFSQGRTLSVNMYILAKEGIDMGEAYATAVVLLATVLALNAVANLLGKKRRKG
nr:phosphate ABC transporter permease PstA [Feifania hominis]